MTETKEKVFLFDPGFAKHTSVLSFKLEDYYTILNQYRNFGQKKMHFKLIYPTIVKLVENNIGFFLGCILWGAYLKTQPNSKIEKNPCLDGTYNETEAVEEIVFAKEYFDKLKKDAKYYMGINYEINPLYINVLELYQEFLTLNHAFTKTKNTDDVILPDKINVPTEEHAKVIYDKIQEVVNNGNLLDLSEVFELIYKG